MNVYVETNFVLELAYIQEQRESCEKILTLCEAGGNSLLLPAFCIAEAFETLIRQKKKRKLLASDLASELRQLARSGLGQGEIEAFQNASRILLQSSDDEEQRMVAVLNRVLRTATVIPLEAEILLAATRHRSANGLEPQDAIVYSSVLHHLSSVAGIEGCFITKNKLDFDDPDIEQKLMAMQCQILFNFDTALHYIQK